MDLSQQKLIAITTKYFTKQDIGLHILATKKDNQLPKTLHWPG